MATADGAYLKELYRLTKDIGKLTEGQSRVELDEDNTRQFKLFVSPHDGFYKGATFTFQVNAEKYPEESPEVMCLNRIYHPNIDLMEEEAASVCVSLLGEDWEPGVGLDGCVMAILFLFYHPNVEDPLSPVIDSNLAEEDFYPNVRASLRGEEVEGFTFDKLIDDEEEDNDKTGVNEFSDKDDPSGISQVTESQNEVDVQTDVNEVPNANAAIDKQISNCQAKTNTEIAIGETKYDTPIERNVTEKGISENGLNSASAEEINARESVNSCNQNITGCEIDTVDTTAGYHGASLKSAVTNVEEMVEMKNITDLKSTEGENTVITSTYSNKIQSIESNMSRTNEDSDGGMDGTRTDMPLTIDILPTIHNDSRRSSSYTWHKTLGIFGRFYRWLKTCTRPQTEIYTISSTISNET